jgi:predicted aspartyl protease
MWGTCSAIALVVLIAVPGGAQSTREEVPFELHNEFMIVVKGSVGELNNLSFAVDTGATQTMVSREIAEKLSLRCERGMVVNFDRQVNIERAEIAELQVGLIKARNVKVMVGDLKQFTDFANGVDGIIGLDILRMSEQMQIDYVSRMITFQSAGGRGVVNQEGSETLLVRLPVQGQTMLLVIDTGLEGMILYEDRLRKHIPKLSLSDKNVQAHARQLTGKKATLLGIRAGGDELQSSVLLIEGAPNTLPDDIDGYLGLTVLNAKLVELDFAGNKIRWQ